MLRLLPAARLPLIACQYAARSDSGQARAAKARTFRSAAGSQRSIVIELDSLEGDTFAYAAGGRLRGFDLPVCWIDAL